MVAEPYGGFWSSHPPGEPDLLIHDFCGLSVSLFRYGLWQCELSTALLLSAGSAET